MDIFLSWLIGQAFGARWRVAAPGVKAALGESLNRGLLAKL